MNEQAPVDEDNAALQWLAELAGSAAAHIHGLESLGHKLQWAVSAARQLTGAQFALFAVHEDGQPRVQALDGVAPADLLLLADDHVREIIRSAIAVTDEGGQADTARSFAARPDEPAPQARVRRRDSGSELGVPVLSRSGSLYGGLIIGHAQPDRFGALQGAVAAAVAAHVGVAMDNLATVTRLSEREAVQREAAHQLQYAVLPPLPTVEGAELGRYYLPADPSSLTGGDLYDWVVLPSGELHLAVVDVLGKGVAATKDALAITHSLRLLVLDGCPLDEVVARADRLVTVQNPDVVATVVVGRFSPTTGELWLAGAGHPPPLLVRSDGAVDEIDAPGVPIGWPGAGSSRVAKVQLERSDTLILYTDGLVESTKDIIAGLAMLVQAARDTAGYPAGHLARALVERALDGAERNDDALAVVVRRRLAPTNANESRLGPFEHRFSPNLAAVPLARHLVSDWLERQPIDVGAVEDLLLVATELCANAVRASSGQPGSIVLRALAEGDAVRLEVEDDGPGFAWPDWDDGEGPEPGVERGRGLYLVMALSDDAGVERRGRHTVAWCAKHAVLGGRAD